MNSRSTLIYLALLFLVLAGTFTMAFHETPAPPIVTERNGAALPTLAGTWTGTWQDTIFNVGGAMSFVIEEDTRGFTATGTIDFTEINFGQGEMTGTATGSAVGDLLRFDFVANEVGTGEGTINGQAASGSGTVVGGPMDFGDYTFTGTATDQVIWGSFDFTSEGSGAGKAMLFNTTPTAPTSMSALKASYNE